jgi:uncharacterized protein YcfJ
MSTDRQHIAQVEENRNYKRLHMKQVIGYPHPDPDVNLTTYQVSNDLSELYMEMNQTSNRIHPLVAGAAVSVMLVSLLGAAAISGILPNSHGTAAETARIAAQAAVVTPVPVQQAAVAPPVAKEVVANKTIVHHQYVQHRAAPARAQPVQVAQAATAPQYSPPPVYQQTQQPAPVAHNSPIGIGVGAVVGGLLGNQVGGGNGKTLATIAGAVGGGYVGNEIAKRSQ